MADQSKKKPSVRTKQNVLEALKDLGAGSASQTKDLIKNTSEDFFKELMGIPRTPPKRSGELSMGESMSMDEVISGKEEENKKLRAQIRMERNLADAEKRLSDQKSNELKVQLQAIIQEVQKVASSTQNLAQEVQVAVIQAPSNPGIYHIVFFEKLLGFLQSFRRKINEASTWLQSSNKRAQKKNYWSTYKKKGSSFLLSPDHYLQRSAG